MSAWLVRAPLMLLLALFLSVTVLDLFFEVRDAPPVGAHVGRWVRRYPVFATLTGLILGTLLAHFFWQ